MNTGIASAIQASAQQPSIRSVSFLDLNELDAIVAAHNEL
jgi:hypothetical protein